MTKICKIEARSKQSVQCLFNLAFLALNKDSSTLGISEKNEINCI